MAWLICSKSPSRVLEVTLRDFTQEFLQNKFGSDPNISYVSISDADANRYNDGSSYAIIWNNGNVVGLDFSEENSKLWIKPATNKINIKDDGIDSATITIEIWRANLTNLANSVNISGTPLPITTPDGTRIVRFNIVNSVATATFKTTKSGTYIFPSESLRYKNLRVFNQVTIEVEAQSLLEIV
jgi:hypothetical protein